VFDNLTDEKIGEHDDGTASIFIYAWPYKSEFRIKLTVIEPDGDRCSIEKVYFDEECFEPCAPTGGGGGAPPYKQDPDPSPRCSIRIKRVFLSDIDEWREPIQMITIKNVKLE
jgi:hypothetical protein